MLKVTVYSDFVTYLFQGWHHNYTSLHYLVIHKVVWRRV